jgi:hypothetical protein
MSAVHTFADLVKYLTENNIPYRADEEAQTVEVPSGQSPPLFGNTYVRWERAVPFIQIIQFMVDDVPADRVTELEAAIVRVNNTLEVGTFGFDHANRRLYSRLTVPLFPEGLATAAVNKLCNFCVSIAVDFLDPMQAVIGGKPGAQVIELFKEKAKPSAPS